MGLRRAKGNRTPYDKKNALNLATTRSWPPYAGTPQYDASADSLLTSKSPANTKHITQCSGGTSHIDQTVASEGLAHSESAEGPLF